MDSEMKKLLRRAKSLETKFENLKNNIRKQNDEVLNMDYFMKDIPWDTLIPCSPKTNTNSQTKETNFKTPTTS